MLSIHPQQVERLRRTLLSEGFKSAGLLQICKRGQVFGYVRRIRYDLEWHVRAFADGRLESEVESPRTTIRHLLSPSYQHDDLLAKLLYKHGIQFTTPQTAPQCARFPSRTTPGYWGRRT
ncbi:MAG TPA: hypothetical protein VLV31_09630 [Candidatus Acidoferrales bacterium]|nr:hypothetical protein [Candidatus Acidoferrales bacterium]